MRLNSGIDILEDKILKLNTDLLKTLLKDRTTKRNIIWATNDYLSFGPEFIDRAEINIPLITGKFSKIIQPRITKEKASKLQRTKEKAEVFTPSWICNEQNNLIDEKWFGYENVFNISLKKNWRVNNQKVRFYSNRKWHNYVDARRLEIACGEAPYLVSRYDTVTGKSIDVNRRIGLLDRKLRIIFENADSEEEYLQWALRAVQSVYGFEYQGDNLLLARENIFYTYRDNVKFALKREPTIKELKNIAHIISWNIWQMDGLKYTVPFGAVEGRVHEPNLFEENIAKKELSYCKIYDWRRDNSVLFVSLTGGEMNGKQRDLR